MARGAVIGNGLAIGTGMTAVMAAEAARRIRVAKVIRVRAPGDTHVGEDIAEIDCRYLFARGLKYSAMLSPSEIARTKAEIARLEKLRQEWKDADIRKVINAWIADLKRALAGETEKGS
jgi:hypothetical protein